MKGPARLLVLVGVLAAALFAIFLVGRKTTPEQILSAAPLIDRVVEAKSAINRVGMVSTRLSMQDEISLGNEILVRERSMGFPPFGQNSKVDQTYVSAVLSRLVRAAHLQRPGMPYDVQVVPHSAINAFALPGGHIIITTGMLAFLQNESELAAVLGHEVSHVDLGHCVERYQYQVQARKFGGVPLAAMASLGARIMIQGYEDEQEAEADRRGMNYAVQAGYHPHSAISLFQRMQAQGSMSPMPETIPLEVHSMVLDGLQDVFASHPSYERRIRELSRAATEDKLIPLTHPAYLGVANYRQRISRDQTEIAREFTLKDPP